MAGRRTTREYAIIVAGFAVAIAAAAPLALHWLTNQPDQRMVDLDVYRSGGQAVLRGAPVYDFMTQPPQLLPFTYPPFAVLLAVPLAFVSWTVAQWVWVGLLLVAAAVAVRYSFADLLDRFRPWAPLLAGVLVAACVYPTPIRDQIRFGQVDLFLVALCLADCSPRPTRWPRGLLVGLGTAVKLVPGVFIVYFLVTGRRREAITAAATAVGATLVAFLALPGDSAAYWFGALFDSDRLGANNGTANQSLRGMLLRLYWPDAVTSAVWLPLVLVVAWIGYREARRAYLEGREIVAVAITGLIAVLVSPVSWIHHLAWLVMAFGALAGAARDRRALAAAAGLWLFFVLPLPFWGIHLLAGHTVPTPLARVVQDAYGLAAIVLVVALRRWAPRATPKVGNESNTRCEHVDMGTLGA